MEIFTSEQSETPTKKPLFDFGTFGGCERCWGTGLVIDFAGHVRNCPRLEMGDVHAPLSAGAEILKLRFPVYPLGPDKLPVSPQAFDLARILTHFPAAEPCKRDFLLNHFYGSLGEKYQAKLRKFSELVAELLDASVPIGARKHEPSGYYFITTADECTEWLKESTSAAIKKLKRNHACARANFPHLTGQTTLDLVGDTETDHMKIAEEVMNRSAPVLTALHLHDTEGAQLAEAFLQRCKGDRQCAQCSKIWPEGGVQDGSMKIDFIPGETVGQIQQFTVRIFCNENCRALYSVASDAAVN